MALHTAQPDKAPPAPRPVVTFDNRLWPVVGAILLLAGIGAAMIVQLADFDSPDWRTNGWTWLGSLTTLTLVWLVGICFADPSRRGVHLAAVLSLIFHIALFAALNEQHLIAMAMAPSPLRPRPEPVEEFRAPDFHIRAPEDPIADFEKPVTTPVPEEQPTELDQHEKQRLEERPPANQPTPVEGEEPEVQPHEVPQREIEEAVPRLAQSRSQLSRSEPQEVTPAEPEPVAAPSLEVATELDAPSPAAADLERSQPQREAPEVRPLGEPAEQATPAAVEVAELTQRPMPDEPAAAAPRAALPGRPVEPAPQIEAPQIANVPRAQSGIDQPLDEPQPLVKVPLRTGTGNRLAVELGTVRNTERAGVSVGRGEPRPAADLSPSLATPNRARGAAAQGSGRSPSTLTPSAAAGRLSKARTQTVPAGSLAKVERPGTTASSESSPAQLPGARPSESAARGRSPARLPVRVRGPQGAGGIATRLTPNVGTPSRRAREDSQVVPATGRLLARTSGGPPTIDGRTREPAEAFARRGGRMRNRGRSAGEPSEQTEAAIELGLMFLAKHQNADGSWSLHYAPRGEDNPYDPPLFRAETAATGLALLSFLGAGYDHYGGQYAEVVQRALDYLVAHQQQDGDLYQPEDEQSNQSARLYSHGMASIALCEAYGMTGDKNLAGPAQRAINFIVDAQDPRRGAWRYVPGNGSDTSVAGWQLMALKSGELAGLEVPESTYDKVGQWLDRAQVAGSQYVYNPAAPDTPAQGHGRRPTPSMTAVGLLMRLYTGLNRDDEHMIEGAEYLFGRLPQNGSTTDPQRDTYYWYYATQVMFHMRGKYWRAWNDRLHPLLVREQIQTGTLAGSWDPRRPVPDRWGPQAGRIYVTTLNLLSLEVYYRHLPLYESTAQ